MLGSRSTALLQTVAPGAKVIQSRPQARYVVLQPGRLSHPLQMFGTVGLNLEPKLRQFAFHRCEPVFEGMGVLAALGALRFAGLPFRSCLRRGSGRLRNARSQLQAALPA